ncbi:hypothetical protein HELRODRAFT_158545 [Helobdella robusta]|uniref:Uncharacterized protein n=1 Tax=Helobdella robusta TaxID=6412 RepID=T1EMY0_HELRO|nr:hypothetical protein HELRODRAFT_158545 [Helobdella robusta]ESO12119.1 hypothetical protein HELRODRAFT_158545 [Helobdella robusta]
MDVLDEISALVDYMLLAGVLIFVCRIEAACVWAKLVRSWSRVDDKLFLSLIFGSPISGPFDYDAYLVHKTCSSGPWFDDECRKSKRRKLEKLYRNDETLLDKDIRLKGFELKKLENDLRSTVRKIEKLNLKLTNAEHAVFFINNCFSDGLNPIFIKNHGLETTSWMTAMIDWNMNLKPKKS